MEGVVSFIYDLAIIFGCSYSMVNVSLRECSGFDQ